MTVANQVPAAIEAARVGPRSTASVGRLLASSAVRYHPAPWIEERLAARLARAASGATGPSAPRANVVAFRRLGAPSLDLRQPRRTLLFGGAIASGVSLAGAAYLAWRHASRPHAPWRSGRRAAG